MEAIHLCKTVSTVLRWCKNEVHPSIETLYEISIYLKVDIRELLDNYLILFCIIKFSNFGESKLLKSR
nr:helix-turn-helix transcriptional regulator [Flavobacterium hibisci]